MKGILILLFVASTLTSFAKETKLHQADSLFGLITFGAKYTVHDTIRIYNADGSLWHWLHLEDCCREPQNKEFGPYIFDPDYFELAMTIRHIDSICFHIVACCA